MLRSSNPTSSGTLFLCVCVCVCVSMSMSHTHTHTLSLSLPPSSLSLSFSLASLTVLGYSPTLTHLLTYSLTHPLTHSLVAPSAFPEGLGLGGSKIRERSDLIKGAWRKNYGAEEERKHISASSPAKRGHRISEKASAFQEMKFPRQLPHIRVIDGQNGEKRHFLRSFLRLKGPTVSWGPHGDLGRPFWSKFWWSQYLR